VKEYYSATGFSVLLHLCIIVIVLTLFNTAGTNTKTILMDFTLLKGEPSYGRGGSGIDSSGGVGTRHGKRNIATPFSSYDHETKNRVVEEKGMVSDPQGDVVVHGNPAPVRGDSSNISGGTPGGHDGMGSGTGEGRILNYATGEGGDRRFYFIRETILKNIRYPEKARRMGWEGKVLLSFVLLQNGKTQDIRIINSSGYPELDGSARETIEKTVFSQNIPYRIVVILPIEYKLH